MKCSIFRAVSLARFFFFSVIPAELLLLLFSGMIPHWLKRVLPQASSHPFSPSTHGSPGNGLSSCLAFFTRSTYLHEHRCQSTQWVFPHRPGELGTQLSLRFCGSAVPAGTPASLLALFLGAHNTIKHPLQISGHRQEVVGNLMCSDNIHVSFLLLRNHKVSKDPGSASEI